MKLWTFQPHFVVDLLKNGERFICDYSQSSFLDDPNFHEAYDWMIKHMTNVIGEQENSATHPIWAWYKPDGENKKPDLRTESFRNYGDHLSLIELEVPDEKVVLSDFVQWHSVLNKFPALSDEEWEAIGDDDDFTPEYTESTWPMIFDISHSRYVQATFWSIEPEYLRKVQKLKH